MKRRSRHKRFNGFLLKAAAAAGLLSCSSVSDAQATQASLLFGRNLVRVDGQRRLNLVCVGDGAPVVVFLQGAGSHMHDWSRVQPAISQVTRTCFYDRPGYGFSDPPVEPMTLKSVARDLRALLRAAGVPPPYVLVGHSVGGFYATYFTDVYRTDVAGLVLVDPAFSGVYDFPRSPADEVAFGDLVAKTFAQSFNCANLATRGKLSRNAPADCFAVQLPKSDEEALFQRELIKPKLYHAELLEIAATAPIGSAAPTDAIEERLAARQFGAMPLIVLTAAKHASLPGLSDEANIAFQSNWTRGHERLARRSSIGSHFMVKDAGHFIQFDQPNIVASSILDVVSRIRSLERRRKSRHAQ